MLPPLPLPSVTSQPKNSGNVISAQPVSVDEVDGLQSPYSVPDNADAGDTEHLQHIPAQRCNARKGTGAEPARRTWLACSE